MKRPPIALPLNEGRRRAVERLAVVHVRVRPPVGVDRPPGDGEARSLGRDLFDVELLGGHAPMLLACAQPGERTARTTDQAILPAAAQAIGATTTISSVTLPADQCDDDARGAMLEIGAAAGGAGDRTSPSFTATGRAMCIVTVFGLLSIRSITLQRKSTTGLLTLLSMTLQATSL